MTRGTEKKFCTRERETMADTLYDGRDRSITQFFSITTFSGSVVSREMIFDILTARCGKSFGMEHIFRYRDGLIHGMVYAFSFSITANKNITKYIDVNH